MSLEDLKQAPKDNLPTERDFQAADELIAENSILANSPEVKELVENLWIKDGRQIDPGNFLAALLDFLATSQNPEPLVLSEVIKRNLVTHSLTTNLENQIENRPQ